MSVVVIDRITTRRIFIIYLMPKTIYECMPLSLNYYLSLPYRREDPQSGMKQKSHFWAKSYVANKNVMYLSVILSLNLSLSLALCVTLCLFLFVSLALPLSLSNFLCL